MTIPGGGMRVLITACFMFVLTCSAQAQDSLQIETASVSLLKIGSIDVEYGIPVYLEEPQVDLFGRALNYGGLDFIALVKPLGQTRWFVGGASNPEAGGVFLIRDVSFPRDTYAETQFELVVGLFRPSEAPRTGWIEESRWRSSVVAISQRTFVRLNAPPLASSSSSTDDSSTQQDKTFTVQILSVANVAVSSTHTTPVAPGGDVLIVAKHLAQAEKIYLIRQAPYGDECYVEGPAQKDQQLDHYRFHAFPLEVPGDIQQLHFKLIAFATTEQVNVGSVSCQAFRRQAFFMSPTVEVLVDAPRTRTDDLRVPFLTITRVGQLDILRRTPAGQTRTAHQGDPIEVAAYERVPEGSRPVILIRPKGSSAWLVQGPAIMRGSSIANTQNGQSMITWVWPSARFESLDDNDEEQGSFEILALLSSERWPNTWIDSKVLSLRAVHVISNLVSVRVQNPHPLPRAHVAITRVGGQDVNWYHPRVVDENSQVEVETSSDFPKSLKVYVGKHRRGSRFWSLLEAIPNGPSQIVPEVELGHSPTGSQEPYQLIAIATQGSLPAEELEYREFLQHAVAVSEIVTLQQSQQVQSHLSGVLLLDRLFGGGIMPSAWVWTLILFFIVLATVNWPLEQTSQDVMNVRVLFSSLPRVNILHLGLGFTLLMLMLHLISHYYLTLYTDAIATVTSLPSRESAGLAIWLIVLTALLGIFVDLAGVLSGHSIGGEKSRPSTFIRGLRAMLIFVAILFMLFQGLLYFQFLLRKQAEDLIPVLGGMAFFFISFIEACTFFFITQLIFPSTEAFIDRLGRFFGFLGDVFSRIVCKACHKLSRTKPIGTRLSDPTQEAMVKP